MVRDSVEDPAALLKRYLHLFGAVAYGEAQFVSTSCMVSKRCFGSPAMLHFLTGFHYVFYTDTHGFDKIIQ